MLQLGEEALPRYNGYSYRIDYTSTSTNVKWNSENSTYYDAGHTITIEEGTYHLSSSKNANPRLWSTNHYVMQDDDYELTGLMIGNEFAAYDGYCVHNMWSLGDKITDSSKLPVFDVYIRKAGEEEFSHYTQLTWGLVNKKTGTYAYKSVDEELNVASTTPKAYNMVILPENTVSFRLTTHTEVYRVAIPLLVNMSVKPSEHVLSQVNSDVERSATTFLKNIAYVDDVLDNGSVMMNHVASNSSQEGTPYIIYVLNPLTFSNEMEKRSLDLKDDPTNAVQSTLERINIRKKVRPAEMFNMLVENQGIIYDLLPYGTYMDPSSIVFGWIETYMGNVPSATSLPNEHVISNYNLELIDNWQQSGRTMLKVTFDQPDLRLTDPEKTNMDIVFAYRLYNPYSNIRDMGINAIDCAAYINTSGTKMARGSYANIARISDAQYFQSIQEMYPDTSMFAQAAVNYQDITVLQTGLTKSSKAQSSIKWSNEDTVIAGKPYNYQLSYSSLDDVLTTGIVLYDVLEAGNKELESEWQGTFSNIDISSIRQKTSSGTTVKCDPKVYYSTAPREQLLDDERQMKDEYEDLTNPVWTDTEPADKSTITAVAVDCRKNTDGTDFVLTGGSILVANISMDSPTDSSLKGKKAVNSVYSETDSYASYGVATGATTRLTNSAAMVLDTYDPELSKESDPPSGTRQDPAQIETNTELTYTINLTNTSAIFPYTNAIVTDDVPEGTSIHVDEIKAYADDAASAKLISEYDGVTLEATGQHLQFTVDELKAGKSIHFIIPVTVTAEEGVLINDAVVKSIDDIDLNIHSNEVIHEVKSKITIHIYKTDNSGEHALAGASFQLTGPDTDLTKETGEDGLATFPDLKAGEYTLKEVKAAPGYQLSGLSWTVTIASGVATVKDLEDHVLTSTLNEDEEQVFHVKDGKVIQLLNTGGTGTRTFAFTGMLLMLLAVYFVKQKQTE